MSTSILFLPAGLLCSFRNALSSKGRNVSHGMLAARRSRVGFFLPSFFSLSSWSQKPYWPIPFPAVPNQSSTSHTSLCHTIIKLLRISLTQTSLLHLPGWQQPEKWTLQTLSHPFGPLPLFFEVPLRRLLRHSQAAVEPMPKQSSGCPLGSLPKREGNYESWLWERDRFSWVAASSRMAMTP